MLVSDVSGPDPAGSVMAEVSDAPALTVER